MILSASRRTDIPSYYAEWFLNRLREGFVYINSPRREERFEKLPLSPETTDCIVFWTKNAQPMMRCLDEIESRGYPYYFTYTITPYGRDIESGLPDKGKVVSNFRELGEKIGRDRLVWRYDPVIFSKEMTVDYHAECFGRMAEKLKDYTDECVVSFLDLYPGTKRGMIGIDYREAAGEEFRRLAGYMAQTAGENHMRIRTCGEKEDLTDCGIPAGACIDRERVRRITGFGVRAKKDALQRPECGCCESVDIGMYNTCMSGCAYCYAVTSRNDVLYRMKRHDRESPMLVGIPDPEDRISEKKIRSLRDGQLSLFEFMEG